ncbi:glycosyltransferase family A protein [Gammaproteobacteria bacterium]|nr:glycosyltransferase family A protein [Gammaproteobacteria bacterium]
MKSISVIICAYNHDKWIERCLRSVLNQEIISKEDFEIIFVDDCSEDSTETILKKFEKEENLIFIKNDKNIGLPASINKAMQDSSGRYIVRVDSDDYVQRTFLYHMKIFLDFNRHYQAVCVDYLKVNQNEEVIERKNALEDEIACGVMFRKECLFDIGLYNEKFTMREGHELRKRFEEKFKIGHLELPLYKYRDHPDNRTKDKESLNKYDKKLKEK